MKIQRAFTLIELLIVIGIISILAGIVLVAVNPATQFGKANDAERKSEISMMLKAVHQYQTSPKARGVLPKCQFGSPATETVIPDCDTDGSGIGVGNGGFEGAVQLGSPASATAFDCSSVLIPEFLREVPIDPDSDFDATATGYFVCKKTAGKMHHVHVIAANAEVYTDDGGCEIPGTTYPAMCVSS